MPDSALVDEIVLWLIETYDVSEVNVDVDEPGVVALEVRINALNGSSPAST